MREPLRCGNHNIVDGLKKADPSAQFTPKLTTRGALVQVAEKAGFLAAASRSMPFRVGACLLPTNGALYLFWLLPLLFQW